MRYVYREGEKECALVIEGMHTPVYKLVRENGQFNDPYIKQKEIEEEQRIKQEREYMDGLNNIPITELHLPSRPLNALIKGKVTTVGELVSLTFEELSNFRNMGVSSVMTIITVLNAKGLRLAEKPQENRDDNYLNFNEDGTYSIGRR